MPHGMRASSIYGTSSPLKWELETSESHISLNWIPSPSLSLSRTLILSNFCFESSILSGFNGESVRQFSGIHKIQGEGAEEVEEAVYKDGQKLQRQGWDP